MNHWKKAGRALGMASLMTGVLFGTACGGTTESEESTKGSIDLSGMAAGSKSDLAKRVKVIDNLSPDSHIKGTFDPRVRTYGYVVEARKGAQLNIALTALAGPDASSLSEGDELDTILAVYGPYESAENYGEELFKTDDSEDSVAAPAIDMKVERDGKYLIVFNSYDDTGAGKYELSIGCDGTDLQCRRPNWDKPCEEGQLFVQGGKVEEDTDWNTCEVILLEDTRVINESTLTIRPGVTVKANFLGDNAYGDVGLIVDSGILHAEGTDEDPILFTSFVEGKGWTGLGVRGKDHHLKHVFIENARTGLNIAAEGSATMKNLTLQNVRNGVQIATKASASFEHVVIEGAPGPTETGKGQIGIMVADQANVDFERALVRSFNVGLQSTNGNEVNIDNSVIRDNQIGVQLLGAEETTSCRSFNPSRHYDPVIRHTDIVDNEQEAVLIRGSDIFLQVSKSNIINNGREALELRGSSLHEESFLRENNIFGNNEGNQQVFSYHRDGTLDLSSNYWVHISDPDLSSTRNARCNGTISFTNFSPTEIEDAGPVLEELIEPVKQSSYKQQQM